MTNVVVTCTTTTYTIGGNVSGLAAGNSVTLRNNGGNDLAVAADGAFTFSTAIADGAAYLVTVFTQPTTPNQTCVVTGGGGNVAGANVTNVVVTCTTTTYTIGGNISGLDVGASVSLQNNGGDTLVRSSDGAFAFLTPLIDESAYAVTVSAQPAAAFDQTCQVQLGSGTIAGANVTTVQVLCQDNQIFGNGFE